MLKFGPVSYPSDSLRKNMNIADIRWKRCSKSTTTPTIVIATVAISIIFSLSIALNVEISWNDNMANAQAPQQEDSLSSENRVTINLNSVTFAPLTYTDNNQLKVLVDYQTNDPSLVNTHMDGTMKVYNPDGTLLKTSSIQIGYVLGKSGIIQFATSFTDKTIQDIEAEIALTDALHEEKISNTLKTNASLEK